MGDVMHAPLEIERRRIARRVRAPGLDLRARSHRPQMGALAPGAARPPRRVPARADIGLDELERFTDEMGGRDITPYVTPVAGRPYVIRVIKEPGDELNFANAWHTDLSYSQRQPSFTILHAWEVPPFGGDTIWANQYLAYETLPADLREQAADAARRAQRAARPTAPGGFLESVQGKTSMAIEPSAMRTACTCTRWSSATPRPAVAALYANPVYTVGIEGWTRRMRLPARPDWPSRRSTRTSPAGCGGSRT